MCGVKNKPVKYKLLEMWPTIRHARKTNKTNKNLEKEDTFRGGSLGDPLNPTISFPWPHVTRLTSSEG